LAHGFNTLCFGEIRRADINSDSELGAPSLGERVKFFLTARDEQQVHALTR
jgi:hypothetical protein